MKLPDGMLKDRSLYAHQISRVKLRIEETGRLLYTPKTMEQDLLYATLQLRLSIEEIACASLIANRSSFNDGQKAFTLQKFDQVQKTLKAVNPDYWPLGIFEEHPDKDGIPTVWKDNPQALSGAEWMRIWGKLSESLHMRNPWDTPRDLPTDLTFAKEVHSKLIGTLSSHLVKLVGGKHLIMARLWTTPVQVFVFSSNTFS